MTPPNEAAAEVETPARIYVASRASVPERPAMWRHLRQAGWPIISTWIDEAGEGETADQGELWSRIEREVTTATALILFVEPDDFPLKGAYIEVGMALAAGVPVYVVAPRVKLLGPAKRPLGSWLCHPLVSMFDRCETALAEAVQPCLSRPTPEAEVETVARIIDPKAMWKAVRHSDAFIGQSYLDRQAEARRKAHAVVAILSRSPGGGDAS